MKVSLYQDFLLNNRVFDLDDLAVNRDNATYSYYLLKHYYEKQGADLATCDINSPNDSDIILYNNIPANLPAEKDIQRSFLLLIECEVVSPRSWVLSKHRHFNKIFTWNDDLVDDKKYFKFNFSHLFPDSISTDITHKNKFCALISANKLIHHPLELYSERVNAIRWFEANHPDEFELYGFGWDEYVFTGPKVVRALNRLKPITRLLAPKFPSYKGTVVEKRAILKNYKFAICYENARDIPGYITEKIFDCFFAACIPIYWGASNIAEHIPSSCYIDKQQFDSYESLYEYLIHISPQEYVGYLNAIDQFIISDQSTPFRAETFARSIVERTLQEVAN